MNGELQVAAVHRPDVGKKGRLLLRTHEKASCCWFKCYEYLLSGKTAEQPSTFGCSLPHELFGRLKPVP
jgi:hypothetical protein